jgi:hypothetical protein
MSANTKKSKAGTKLSKEQRQQYIEIAAYYIAERNKADCCCDLDNWLAAEAEIDQLLTEGKLA